MTLQTAKTGSIESDTCMLDLLQWLDSKNEKEGKELVFFKAYDVTGNKSSAKSLGIRLGRQLKYHPEKLVRLGDWTIRRYSKTHNSNGGTFRAVKNEEGREFASEHIWV